MHAHYAVICYLVAQVVTSTPLHLNDDDCINGDEGLEWLSQRMSDASAIICRQGGHPPFMKSTYWAAQYVNNASVTVFPASSLDVSYAVQATRRTPLGNGYAFVCGGHALTGASTSIGFLIDLARLNHTTVLHDFSISDITTDKTVVMYEGGVKSLGLQMATNGTGWTAVSARASGVGMGGFTTGGGIGFAAGAYGYALDRLVALEVVLPSGRIVLATKTNQFLDLFWAIQGGSGQFGIVTKFYQEAFRTPSAVKVGYYVVANESSAQSYRNTEVFFREHSDPFSLVYYALAYLPRGWPNVKGDEIQYQTIRLLVTLWYVQ